MMGDLGVSFLPNPYADASAAAITHLSSDAPLATSVTDTPAATPIVPDPATPVTPDPAEPPTPELKGQTYKVKVQNEEIDVPIEELLKGYSRTSDYTKKAMSLAEQRKAFETEQQSFNSLRENAKQREEALAVFLRDADQIKAYYEYLTQGQQVSPQVAAQQQDVQQMLARQQQHMEQQLSQVQQMTQAELHKVQSAMTARQAQELQGELTKTIDGILAHPDLKILSALGEDVAEILAGDAMRLQPKTLADAKAAIQQVAEARAEGLSKHYKEMLKETTAKQAALTNKGIEPPGGQGITPSPKKMKLGSKDLTSAATEWVKANTK